MIELRGSMIPDYQDCARRAAAKQFWPLITSRGFQLRQLMPSIGSAIGTAAHLAIRRLIEFAKENQQAPKFNLGLEESYEKFREEVAGGTIWDKTTDSIDKAYTQIEKIVRAYSASGDLDNIPPETLIEAEFTAFNGPEGYKLTIHPDRVMNSCIDDWKTGIRDRQYHGQLGAYYIVLKANKIPIDSARIWKLPRATRGTTLVIQPYDIEACRRTAAGVIRRIVSDHNQFKATSDPEGFNGNTASQMCSAKYCPAYGTTFCSLWKEKEKNDDE